MIATLKYWLLSWATRGLRLPSAADEQDPPERMRLIGRPLHLQPGMAEVAGRRFLELAALREWDLIGFSIGPLYAHVIVGMPEATDPRHAGEEMQCAAHYEPRPRSRKLGKKKAWWDQEIVRHEMRNERELHAACQFLHRDDGALAHFSAQKLHVSGVPVNLEYQHKNATTPLAHLLSSGSKYAENSSVAMPFQASETSGIKCATRSAHSSRPAVDATTGGKSGIESKSTDLLECRESDGMHSPTPLETMTEKRRLGRGLDALLGGPAEHFNGEAADVGQLTQVPVAAVQENPYQPRKDFDPDELAGLKESMLSHGLLQPIVVRSLGGSFQLVAGERRLRAARDAGWTDIPVRIVDFNDQQVFEAAMIENLHRADLNPIEKAQGFQDYLNRFEVTQEQLAHRLGIDRSTITNLVRLLELSPAVQDAIRTSQISHGHAKAMLTLDDPVHQEALCREIMAKGLSVRAAEAQAKQFAEAMPTRAKAATKKAPVLTKHVKGIEEELRQRLAAKVEIRLRGESKGQIVLHFESNDDFERMVEALRR